jgi:hypothetical protein
VDGRASANPGGRPIPPAFICPMGSGWSFDGSFVKWWTALFAAGACVAVDAIMSLGSQEFELL